MRLLITESYITPFVPVPYSSTYFITNSMEQRPFQEADSHSASEEIVCLLWNLKGHYHVHICLPLFPLLRQMNPAHDFPPCFSKIHSIIILPSMSRSYEWSLPFRFSKQNFVCMSLLVYAACPFHLTFPGLITPIIFGKAY